MGGEQPIGGVLAGESGGGQREIIEIVEKINATNY
jgi:hypothetical protein